MALNKKRGLIATLAITCSLCSVSLLAASTPVGVGNAGVAMKNVEANRPMQATKANPKLDLPARPPMNAPVGSLKLRLSQFDIAGNTIFSDNSLKHIIRGYIKEETSFADLLRAANEITNFYRDAGYLVARAYVPEQEIQDGVVEITILEGLVGNVNLNNNSATSNGLVGRYISKVKSGEVVSRDNVERAMLLLNDLPGVEASAAFKVGQSEGTTDLDVMLKPTKRITGSLDANNYGSDFTGQGRIGGSVYINSLLGMGDALGLRILASEDAGTIYGSVDYSLAVGGYGTRVGVKYSNLNSDVGDTFSNLDLESEADTLGLYVAHPILRSRNNNLYAQMGIESREVEQTFAGALASSNSEDEVTVLTAAFTGDFRDSILGGGVSSYGVAVQQGLDDLDPISVSKLGADGKFLKLDLTYQRLQYLNDATSLSLKLAGQFTGDPLVSSEQFSLGGPNGVRAFINGEGLADSAFVMNAEVRHTLPFKNKFITNTQLVGFYDYGKGEVTDPITGTESDFDLGGIGLGLTVGIIGNYQLGVSYAHSTSGAALTDDDDGQFLLQAVKWFQ